MSKSSQKGDEKYYMMELSDFAKKYNFAESTVKQHFSRVQKQIAKDYAILITKHKADGKTYFKEEIYNEVVGENQLAIQGKNMFSKKLTYNEKAGLSEDELRLSNCAFQIFIGVLTTPMMVFRGTYEDLGEYLNLGKSKIVTTTLKKEIKNLSESKMVIFYEDDDVVIISIKRDVELKLKLGMEMLIQCRIIGKQEHYDWINLFKVWAAIEIFGEQDTIFTLDEISFFTNLSVYHVRKSLRILQGDNKKHDNILVAQKIYYYDHKDRIVKCSGQVIDVNAFYYDKKTKVKK